MKRVNLSDPDLDTSCGEPLLYELQLLDWTSAAVPSAKKDVLRYVLIESFVIHLRNLIDFFYTPRREDDDVIAADFCPGWHKSIPNTLKEAKERANKELSHLTLGRKSGLHPEKPWDVSGLFQEVHGVAKRFAVKAAPTKLHAEVQKFLTLPKNDALPTTNTSSLISTTSGSPPTKGR